MVVWPSAAAEKVVRSDPVWRYLEGVANRMGRRRQEEGEKEFHGLGLKQLETGCCHVLR